MSAKKTTKITQDNAAHGGCSAVPCSPSFLFCDGCGKVHEETDDFLICECGRIAMRMEWATPAQIAVERGHPCQRCGYCGFIEDADGNLAGECPECLGRAAKIHRENEKLSD
jgi:hypothetical protein